MRTSVALECTECKRRNYRASINKKTQVGRLEQIKYCTFCKKRTVHKETK